MPISPPEEEDSDSSPEYDNDDYGDEEYGNANNNEAEDSVEDSQEESIHEEAQDEIRENSLGTGMGELIKKLGKSTVELKNYSEQDVVKKVEPREKKEE